jgi:drug/metabolite transporter (DMT)-like permease
MRVEVLAIIMLAALLLAVGNMLLLGGISAFGGLSLDAPLFLQITRLMTQPLFLMGVFLYAVGTFIWFFALSMGNLSSSYPVLVGATFIFVTLGALIFFHETISITKIIGMLLIVFGILSVAIAS